MLWRFGRLVPVLLVGVNFSLTKPISDPQKAEDFFNAYQPAFSKLEVPILVGFLPLVSDRHARFLHNEVPGISIPEKIHERVQKLEPMEPKKA